MLSCRIAAYSAVVVAVVAGAAGNDGAADRTSCSDDVRQQSQAPAAVDGNASSTEVPQLRAYEMGCLTLLQAKSHLGRLVVMGSDDVNGTSRAKDTRMGITVTSTTDSGAERSELKISPLSEKFNVSFIGGAAWRLSSRRVWADGGSWVTWVLMMTGLVLLCIGGCVITQPEPSTHTYGDRRWRGGGRTPASRDVRMPQVAPPPKPVPAERAPPMTSTPPNVTFDRSSFASGMSQKQEGISSDSDHHFCQDLVVPPFTECMLIVPIRSFQDGAVAVTDTNGSLVLHISVRGNASSQRCLVLSTATGETLAQCCTSGTAEFQLLRAAGDLFASLKRGEATMGGTRYLLTTVAGSRFHFWGAFEHHAVNITDDAGKLLATTEVCQVDFDTNGQYYRLRVAPLTDVGLILCGLLCIQHLEVCKA